MSKNARKSPAKPKRPKTKLGLPDLDHSKSAVLDSLPSRESKRGYRHAIDEFIQWYCSEPRLSFSKVVVTRYRDLSRIEISPPARSMGGSRRNRYRSDSVCTSVDNIQLTACGAYGITARSTDNPQPFGLLL